MSNTKKDKEESAIVRFFKKIISFFLGRKK